MQVDSLDTLMRQLKSFIVDDRLAKQALSRFKRLRKFLIRGHIIHLLRHISETGICQSREGDGGSSHRAPED